MLHHPIIFIPKLVVLAILIILLVILHGTLPPEQFRIAAIASAVFFVIFVIVLWIVVFKLLSNPESRISQATTLFAQVSSEDGYVASSNEFEALLGASGKSLSPLRPSGTALIEKKRMSVITSGEFIAAGSAIEVIKVRGSKIVVKVHSELENQK